MCSKGLLDSGVFSAPSNNFRIIAAILSTASEGQLDGQWKILSGISILASSLSLPAWFCG
jgi:hypothetical protein